MQCKARRSKARQGKKTRKVTRTGFCVPTGRVTWAHEESEKKSRLDKARRSSKGQRSVYRKCVCIGNVKRKCVLEMCTRQDTTRQDKTRQDKTRQDKTRQDKTRQDKTR